MATQRTYNLTEARYPAGVDSSLSLLDAQRELYTAQQSLIVTQLARETNLVTYCVQARTDEPHMSSYSMACVYCWVGRDERRSTDANESTPPTGSAASK